MPTNLSGRFTLTLIVTLVSLFGMPFIGGGIFPIRKLMDPEIPWSQKHNLKPGIDMAGGTKLLYEIKAPEEMKSPQLVQEVMSSLKRRVDPEGVQNYIWRPQGSDRLEIQMPRTAKSEGAEEARLAYVEAQERIESLNVRIGQVLAVARDTSLSADARRETLMKLARGSEKREELFGALLSVVDQRRELEKAFEAGDLSAAERAAPLAAQQESLLQQIEQTNVRVATLESFMEMPDGQQRLVALKESARTFPAMLEALEHYEQTWQAFAPFRRSLDTAAELKRMLQGSGVLSFHVVADDLPADRRAEMERRLQELGPVASAMPDVRWFEVNPQQYKGPTTRFGDKQYILAYTTPDKSMINREGEPRWALERARVSRESEFGAKVVTFQFDPIGGNRFGQLTGANRGRNMAIALDGVVINAPTIQSTIFERGQISGTFSPEELKYLEATLNAGSLPAQLSEAPISEQTVGPQLGKDNLRTAFIACISGLVLTAVFLIGYYYMAGVIAMIAVLLNMIMILGAMAALDATFTLPGVAGIVLTIGMAVDANVLIYERLREEQKRGLSINQALRNAYERAWSAIVDANVTTLITAILLYIFGSEEVKGFGLTLTIGLITSLFTSLYVTKTIFAFLLKYTSINQFGSLPLTFPRWDALITPKIDWLAKAKVCFALSFIFIIGGCSVVGWKWRTNELYDIEFAGGTSVTFELAEPMPQQEVRALINAQSAKTKDLPSPSVVAVGTDNRIYEVVSPNGDAEAVRRAVTQAMQGLLTTTTRVQFAGADLDAREAIGNGTIIPLTGEQMEINGWVPDSVMEHMGGAAIVLRDLQPQLNERQLTTRINQFRLRPTAGGTGVYRDFDVETAPDGALVVLVSDPDLSFSLNEERWTSELVTPMWQLVTAALADESDLQRVSNFGQQVAGEMRRDALAAVILSIIVIMAYIWLRFGDLRYATATVVALVHDMAFTVAAIGYAHLLSETFVGDALLLTPFRVDLTLVAALLTVLGWSMNDTVVIFDRIRENRGKFGVLSPKIINDSVNQTMPRTLLTGGTTIVTLLIMYVFGGSGIHGFTFTMLIGILTGTYSSIVIASPVLLWGGSKATAGERSPVGQLQQVGG